MLLQGFTEPKICQKTMKITCMPYQDPLASPWDRGPQIWTPGPLTSYAGQLVSHGSKFSLAYCAGHNGHCFIPACKPNLKLVKALQQVSYYSCTVEQGLLSSELYSGAAPRRSLHS